MKPNEVIVSADGSNTLISDTFGVPYHSIHGALEESIHVFASAGVFYKYLQGVKKINIFEMGFGTGLNAWLSYLESTRLNITINYTGIELYPIEAEIYGQLNYTQQLKSTADQNLVYKLLHKLTWNKPHQVSKHFTFIKHKGDVMDFVFEKEHYDVVFFDAFAPNSQDYLWDATLHERIYKSLNQGGCLVTYCAKGVFKRMLRSLGYEVQALNGPSRKHEMTRAVKI